MSAWWLARTQRERNILTVSGILLLVLFLVFGFWMPLQDHRQHQHDQLQRLYADLEFVHLASAQILAAQSQRDGPSVSVVHDQSLLGIVDSTARASGLLPSVQRVQPEGPSRVRVWMDNASFAELMRWLDMLRLDYAVEVAELSVDRVATPGRVNARLMLQTLTMP